MTWEDKFREWAKPPSDAEQTRCDNTIKAIRAAIDASSKLNQRNIKVFPQGSYHNNTNVRRDSDVDVGVVCFDTFFPDYPDGTDRTTFGNRAADYHYDQFKNEVGEALVNYFGSSAVTRGNKAFDIQSSRTGVEADVAAFFEHRRYSKSGSYESGVELKADNGKPPKVINWPDQHHENGVKKNNDTSRRYKSVVRILKNLRNEMHDQGNASATPIIGFLNECLTWNVPNTRFGHTTFYEDVRESLAFLYNATKTDQGCSNWGEVSELKYLFNSQQKWKRQQANDFVLAAWRYIGFQ